MQQLVAALKTRKYEWYSFWLRPLPEKTPYDSPLPLRPGGQAMEDASLIFVKNNFLYCLDNYGNQRGFCTGGR